MNDKDMNGGEKTMKSNRKKRIIAAVLCMVMVLSSSISALAGEEIFVDIPEASEEFSSEPMVVTMSISEAPLAIASLVSKTFVAVVLYPFGKPITVQIGSFPST